jgi:hypothetical protein
LHVSASFCTSQQEISFSLFLDVPGLLNKRNKEEKRLMTDGWAQERNEEEAEWKITK